MYGTFFEFMIFFNFLKIKKDKNVNTKFNIIKKKYHKFWSAQNQNTVKAVFTKEKLEKMFKCPNDKQCTTGMFAPFFFV